MSMPGGSEPNGQVVRGQVLHGVLQLALLRAEGFGRFGNSRHAFLSSLMPLLAFPVGGALFDLLTGGGIDDLSDLLGSVVALLAPPVLSEAMARRFGRQREWLRYATAFNWTRWVMLLALAAAVVLMVMLASLGLDGRTAVVTGLLALAGYAVVLDWFMASAGLRLVWWRAAELVIVVNSGAALLFIVPRVLAWLTQGAPE